MYSEQWSSVCSDFSKLVAILDLGEVYKHLYGCIGFKKLK